VLSPPRDEPGIRALRADQLLAAHRRRKIRKLSETPTVKTAGIFTIADLDNNSHLKHTRGQSIPTRHTLTPIRSLSGDPGLTVAPSGIRVRTRH
jgi:hypothetical protein